MASNFHELPRVVEIADEIGATRVHVEPLVPYTADLEQERIPGYAEEPYASTLVAARARAAELSIDLVGVGIGGVGGVDFAGAVERMPADFEPSDESDAPQDVTPGMAAVEAPVQPSPIESVGADAAPADAAPADPAPKEEPARAETTETDGAALAREGAETLPEASASGPVPLLCAQPFSQIYVERDGRVRTCCYGVHDLGNLNESSMEEIWNGPRFRSLRRAMWTGRIPFECEQCVELGRIPPVRYEEAGFEMQPPPVVPQGRPLSVVALVEESPDVLRDAFRVSIGARLESDGSLTVEVEAELDVALETGLTTNVVLEALVGDETAALAPPLRVDVTGREPSKATLDLPVPAELRERIVTSGARVRLRVLDLPSGLELASATAAVSR